MYKFVVFLAFAFGPIALFAQNNDECSGATLIQDPSNYCSPAPGDDNSSATPSPEIAPSCFGFTPLADVWYQFTAVAPDLLITVKGLTPSFPNGTLLRPQIAVYSGSCGNLTEVGCVSDFFGSNNLPLFLTNLVLGQPYFIRVDGLGPGLFQCCVKNRNTVNVVSSDCANATFICSKNQIYLEEVYGPGSDLNEVTDAPCFSGSNESSSAWYVFTAANNGNLEFTLTPNDPADDLDFILYRLPNGPGDCSGKIIERCMGAGDLDPASPCMGPTGLNSSATDINQPFGCPLGADNWLRFLKLVAGETYALVINDFTSIGNGFTIDWGGTALFEGATTARFVTDEPDQKICLGEALLLTDSSFTSDGVLNSWFWDFGNGATPATATGQGPQLVQYQTSGPKAIILGVSNEEGCVNFDTAFVLVENCCGLEVSLNVQPGCPGSPATATVEVQNAVEPLTVSWSNSQSGISTEIDSSGAYGVVVIDATGCRDSLDFIVNTPLNVSATFPADTSEILNGASITLTVTTVPSSGVTVQWINQGDTLTGPVQALRPVKTTTYRVVVNNMGCIFEKSITIVVKEPSDDYPNAFTPNGDGANDAFGPVLVGHTLIRLEVWSRWGEKVFDSLTAGKDKWDGTINGVNAPSDVYVYRVNVRKVDGTEVEKKGDVTLLR